jgi:dienelactone hydrolase
VLLYGVAKRPRPLALVSHGYGGRNSAYSFIARHLAARGFVVASVQHELPGDAALPTEGEPAVVRRPSWAQGARSLVFVAETLRARGVAAGGAVVLVGHSHGGDTSLLLAAEQPDFARAVFTLDSRRMAFPRTAAPRICSVRSSDQVADPGVLPDAAEAARLGMVILAVPGLAHNDMWDGATEAQKQAVLAALDRCLGPER